VPSGDHAGEKAAGSFVTRSTTDPSRVATKIWLLPFLPGPSSASLDPSGDAA
jgi:hypothetical protein